VRFWDTSAIIPLWIAEQSSTRAKAWYRNDPDIIVWTLTRVEVFSAWRGGAGKRRLPQLVFSRFGEILLALGSNGRR
jgi:hypothetical protein